ncbi:MAG: hypothetical protein EXQ58_05040 [Acidobacteria bacterium]|nr:hypothetical protein [Acidobacteriota bacterium]
MLLSLGLRNFHGPAFRNERLQACTPWKLVITNLSAGALNIATGKTKWDVNYQKKIGLITRPAELEPPAQKQFEQISKRIYQVLGLSGYVKVDYRMAENGSHLLPRSERQPPDHAQRGLC